MAEIRIQRETAEKAVQKIYEYLEIYADLVRLLKNELEEEDFERTIEIIGESFTPVDTMLKIIFEQFPDLRNKRSLS